MYSSPPCLTGCCIRPRYISLSPWFKSSISHNIRSLVQVWRATSSVLCNTFEFLIGLESEVNCDNVKNYDTYDNSADKSRRFLNKSACSMRVSFNSLFLFLSFLSILISFLLSCRHFASGFTILYFFFFLFFMFSLLTIVFIFFLSGWFWVVLVIFIRIRVFIRSIFLATRQFLPFVCLEVKAKYNY